MKSRQFPTDFFDKENHNDFSEITVMSALPREKKLRSKTEIMSKKFLRRVNSNIEPFGLLRSETPKFNTNEGNSEQPAHEIAKSIDAQPTPVDSRPNSNEEQSDSKDHVLIKQFEGSIRSRLSLVNRSLKCLPPSREEPKIFATAIRQNSALETKRPRSFLDDSCKYSPKAAH